MVYESEQVRALNNEVVRGSVTWDLEESILFTPGDTIPITVTITNPTEEERLYFLGWGLIRNGEMISFGGVEIEEIEDWIIDGNASHEISFELSPEFTDCYLNLLLIGGLTDMEEEEEVIEEIIDGITTYLYSTAVPVVQPLAVQAQWFSTVMIGLVAVSAVVTLLPKIISVVKEKK